MSSNTHLSLGGARQFRCRWRLAISMCFSPPSTPSAP